MADGSACAGAVVRKPPREEIAGRHTLGVQRALRGIEGSARGTYAPRDLSAGAGRHRGVSERVLWSQPILDHAGPIKCLFLTEFVLLPSPAAIQPLLLRRGPSLSLAPVARRRFATERTSVSNSPARMSSAAMMARTIGSAGISSIDGSLAFRHRGSPWDRFCPVRSLTRVS